MTVYDELLECIASVPEVNIKMGLLQGLTAVSSNAIFNKMFQSSQERLTIWQWLIVVVGLKKYFCLLSMPFLSCQISPSSLHLLGNVVSSFCSTSSLFIVFVLLTSNNCPTQNPFKCIDPWRVKIKWTGLDTFKPCIHVFWKCLLQHSCPCYIMFKYMSTFLNVAIAHKSN